MNSEVVKEKIHTEPILEDFRYVILLSVTVLLCTLIVTWLYSRRTRRQAILFLGLSESGKTLLFIRLVYSQYRQTFTSMKVNTEEYVTQNNTLKIVDVPGQERLRNKFFDQHKSNTKAIVYVIDSTTIQKDIRDVAEYLYNIMCDPVIQNSRPPVLILCNKQDQPLAKGSQVIKTLLEKEMHLVRQTKPGLLSTDTLRYADMHALYLGSPGVDFELRHLKSRVDIVECSANTGDDDKPTDLKALEDWMSKI